VARSTVTSDDDPERMSLLGGDHDRRAPPRRAAVCLTRGSGER
jgi:hypothetical protein